MKHLLIISIIYFVNIISSNAQTFSLLELMRLRSLTYPDFETIVTRKGYQYIETENSDFANSYSFGYDENRGRASRFISYSVFNHDRSVHVYHQTSYLSDYNRLKKSALETGFKYYETGPTVNKRGVYITYRKGKREIVFISSRDENSYGDTINSYEISIK